MGARTYINRLWLVSESAEIEFIKNLQRTCYSGVYPFKIFPDKGLRKVEFAPVTVFYGGNGSGKTTLLNVIAQAAGVTRHSAFAGGAFFQEYVDLCRLEGKKIPLGSQILASDDVSDYMLNIRRLNDGIDDRREDLFDEWIQRKYGAETNPLRSLADYDEWLETHEARHRTQSRYVRERLHENLPMFSNGETAMKYYTERIDENAMYLIDEPENSLSPRFQLELAEYLTTSARYCGCQFVIATHSPFLLSLPDAAVYDLDADPAQVRDWTELENVRVYYEFFRQHARELEGR